MKCLPLSVQTTYEPMLTRFFYVVSFWLPRLVEWENSTVRAHRAKKKEGKLPVRKKKKPTVTARTALNRWLLRLLDPQPPCTRFEKNSPMPGSAPGHLLSVSRRKKRQKQTRDQKLKGKWVNQCLFTRTRLLFQYKLGDLLNTPILRFMHHSSIYILLIDQGEQNQHKTPNICY